MSSSFLEGNRKTVHGFSRLGREGGPWPGKVENPGSLSKAASFPVGTQDLDQGPALPCPSWAGTDPVLSESEELLEHKAAPPPLEQGGLGVPLLLPHLATCLQQTGQNWESTPLSLG